MKRLSFALPDKVHACMSYAANTMFMFFVGVDCHYRLEYAYHW